MGTSTYGEGDSSFLNAAQSSEMKIIDDFKNDLSFKELDDIISCQRSVLGGAAPSPAQMRNIYLDEWKGDQWPRWEEFIAPLDRLKVLENCEKDKSREINYVHKAVFMLLQEVFEVLEYVLQRAESEGHVDRCYSSAPEHFCFVEGMLDAVEKELDIVKGSNHEGSAIKCKTTAGATSKKKTVKTKKKSPTPKKDVRTHFSREKFSSDSEGNAFRRPDALIYAANRIIMRLGACMQRLGVISFEMKSLLANKLSSAVQAGARDYSLTLARRNLSDVYDPMMFFTDGEKWRFALYQAFQESTEAKIIARITNPVDVREEGSLLRICQLLLRIILASLLKADSSTEEGSMFIPILKVSPGTLTPLRFLDVKQNRMATLLCTWEPRSPDEEALREIVLKFPARKALGPEHDKKLHVRVKEENKCLSKKWGNSEHIASCFQLDIFRTEPTVCTLFAGESLETWVSDWVDYDSINALAFHVFTKVGTALKKLHKANYAFVDHHPGNIVLENVMNRNPRETYPAVGCDIRNAVVRLVDLESMAPLGRSLKGTLKCKKFQPVSSENVASSAHDWQCLVFVVAFVVDYKKTFRKLKFPLQERRNFEKLEEAFNDTKAELLRRIEEELGANWFNFPKDDAESDLSLEGLAKKIVALLNPDGSTSGM